MIGVSKQAIRRNYGLHLLESSLTRRRSESPKLSTLWQVEARQRRKDMRAPWKQIVVKSDKADKATKLTDSFGLLHVDDAVHLTTPGLGAVRREPVAEEVSLLDGPFALERVHREIVLLQASQDGFEQLDMFLPCRLNGLSVR